MSLIPCDDDCVYQCDGYCKLEAPTIITNHLGGCVHYVKAEGYTAPTAGKNLAETIQEVNASKASRISRTPTN